MDWMWECCFLIHRDSRKWRFQKSSFQINFPVTHMVRNILNSAATLACPPNNGKEGLFEINWQNFKVNLQFKLQKWLLRVNLERSDRPERQSVASRLATT